MPVLFSRNTSEPSQLQERLGYRFRDLQLLGEALTHKSFQHEHSGGRSAHNERLEFLGDSVLGLVIAETLFLEEGLLDEADMSKMKSYLVNKVVLYEIAEGLSLGTYVMLGRGEESTGGRQKRSILADTLEALFGAVFLDSDYETVKSLIRRLYKERIADVIAKKEGYDFKSELQESCQAAFGTLPEYRIIKQEGEEHRKIFTAEVLINESVFGRGTGKSKKEAQMLAAKEALEKMQLHNSDETYVP
ncbi:MAG TPA: ribonuclease III [Dissulfurispiraceae bacterium]|nr:ribonuclease III [Dissulfurispiraceae bacterium]